MVEGRTGAFAENLNSRGTYLLPMETSPALLLGMNGLIGHHD